MLGLLGVARLMRFVPRQVMVGFVNALAILIFLAPAAPRRRALGGLPMVAVGIAIIVGLPPPHHRRALAAGRDRRAHGVRLHPDGRADVGDEGACPTACRPSGCGRAVDARDPADHRALRVAMALVGLLESLLTAKLVDDITDTPSDKTREAWGQAWGQGANSSPASSAAWAAAR